MGLDWFGWYCLGGFGNGCGGSCLFGLVGIIGVFGLVGCSWLGWGLVGGVGCGGL